MASADLSDELKCSICLNTYTDPTTLRCGHSFCWDCVDHVLDLEGAGGFSCPECREEFQQWPDARKNKTLCNIVEKLTLAPSGQKDLGILRACCIPAPGELEVDKLQQQLQDQSLSSPKYKESPLAEYLESQFPAMDEDTEVDAYLEHFEKICCMIQLPQMQWPQYLMPGLRGKALKTFLRLATEKEDDYEAIKNAIFISYQLTPQFYRQKFRSMSKEPGETYSDLAYHLSTAFRRWTDALKIDSYESLRELMVQEQFLETCPADVQQYVRQRKPRSATEAADLADFYKEIQEYDCYRTPHGASRRYRKGRKPPASTFSTAVCQNYQPGAPGTELASADTRRCYTCGKAGHLRNTCSVKKPTLPGQLNNEPSSVSGKPRGNTKAKYRY